MKKKLFSLLLVLILVFLAGCGSSAKPEDIHNEGSAEMPAEDVEAGELLYQASGVQTPQTGQKLVQTVYLTTETEDMDSMLTQMEEQIAAIGGYIENRELDNGSAYYGNRHRWANLTVRIPADKLNQAVEQMHSIAHVTRMTEEKKDITLQYVDTQGRCTALETEEKRLLELLEQAETMEDLLAIESHLTEVRYELESVTSQLRVLDNQVNYATMHLEICEVVEYTPAAEQGRWEKISFGFKESLKNIGEGTLDAGVFLIANSPYLLILAAGTVLVIFLVRRARSKHKKQSTPKSDEKSES